MDFRTNGGENAFTEGFDILPDELLVEIAQHLEHHDGSKRLNLRSLSLVSKRWLDSTNHACTSLSLSGLKASKLPALLARFPDLTALNLTFLFDCTEAVLETIGKRCGRLKELHFPDSWSKSPSSSPASSPHGRRGDGAPGVGVAAVCRGCPRLAVLSLPGYKGPESALMAIGQSTMLRELRLKSAPNLTDDVVLRIAAGCRKVQDLDLSFNSITDAALEAIGRYMTSLQRLDLKHCKRVTGHGITQLAAGCRDLRTLHLGVVEMDDEGITALGRFSSKLEELSLDYGTGAGGNFSREAMAALAMGCRHLRTLSLRGSKAVDDASLKGLSVGCPALEELDLHACEKVGDVGLLSIVEGCKKLRVLVLTGTSVGSSGAPDLFRGGVPNLAVLRLNGELVNNTLLESIGANCKAVEELHLSNCLISDAGLERVLCGCPRLHTLAIKACADVQGVAFAVAGKCSALHSVQLPSCGVTDDGLSALVEAAPGIINLTLSSCLKMTPDGLRHAIPQLRSLSTLIITGCPQVGRDDVLRLTRAARIALKTIRVSRPGSLDDEYTLKRQHVGWLLPNWARSSCGSPRSSRQFGFVA